MKAAIRRSKTADCMATCPAEEGGAQEKGGRFQGLGRPDTSIQDLEAAVHGLESPEASVQDESMRTLTQAFHNETVDVDTKLGFALASQIAVHKARFHE